MWKKIACARKWPIWKPRAPYPNEAANQQEWATLNRAWSTLQPFVQDAYRHMVVGSTLTGKDLYVISYYRGIDYGES